MSKELITVVTVCFNAGQTIAKTMQSVLNQTYRPLEYILVDGKSTDNTLNIIYELEPLFHEKGIAVRIVSEKDKGIFDAMNKGVKLANGRWVNFMNAGDVFYNALNPQLHSRSATYIKRNGLLIRKITIKSSRPFQCAYHPLTP